MLTGSELLAKVKDLGEASKTELVRATGYVTTKEDGTEHLNFTAFYEALLEAKGIHLGPSRWGSTPGRKLSDVPHVLFNGNLLIGKAYTVDLHQARLGRTLQARTLLADLFRGGQHPHPAVLVAVALVVQASTGGVGALCPHLIHQLLRGSLRLELSDRQRVARVLKVVRNDQSLAYERVLLSPFLSRGHAAWVNPAMVLVSLAADQPRPAPAQPSPLSPLVRVSSRSQSWGSVAKQRPEPQRNGPT